MGSRMERVLIVGNGYAGLEAARGLARDGRAEITIVSADPCPAYCPHLLPGVAVGKRTPEDVFLAGRDENAALAAAFRAGSPVARLDGKSRTAVLASGEEIRFDKAIIASGSRPAVPAALSAAFARCRNVRGFRGMEDAVALRGQLARERPRILIVGAGRVGVLLAEAFRDTNAVVTLAEIGAEILPTMLSGDFAARVRSRLERPGLTLRLGVSVDSVSDGAGNAVAVRLSDGTELPTDAVVVAAGVDPNHGFLDPELRDPGGLFVDPFLESRLPGVYAAGDVIQFETVTGRREPGQLAMNARAQGAVAARNVLGEGVRCPPMFTGNVVKVDSFVAARIGDIRGSDRRDVRIGRSAARFSLEEGAAVGLEFAGDPEDLKGLCPAVLKAFRPDDVVEMLRGAAGAGFGPFLLARGSAWD